MLAIELGVVDVVDQVAGRRDGAEPGEGDRRVGDRVEMPELRGEQEAGKDEQVLDPLLRTQGDDRRPQRAAARLRGPAVGGYLRHLRLGPLARKGPGHETGRVVTGSEVVGRLYSSR